MPPKRDLIGQKLGRLFVVKEAQSVRLPCGRLNRRYFCHCECGAEKIIDAHHLMRGRIRSCGCLKKETSRDRMLKHGLSRIQGKPPKEYTAWQNMKARCCDETNIGYKNYGGRGIKICDRWLHNYENFLIDMGPRPRGTSLDRINNDGNYEPGNCRWATRKEQANNCRNNTLVEWKGEKYTMSEFCRKHSLPYRKFQHLSARKGLSPEELLSDKKANEVKG